MEEYHGGGSLPLRDSIITFESGGSLRKLLSIAVLLFVGVSASAAESKRDFKGLFGSFRRERFIENEARSSDLGIDFMLSTLLPITSVVKSSEVSATDVGQDMYYATSFNFEATLFFSVNYNWELFANVGFDSYETRKENSRRDVTQLDLPLFHQFEMDLFPVIGGIKYRFSAEDIVPYIGLGAGMAYVRRKAFYDYNNALVNQQHLSAFTADFILGVEFYYASRAGIRLEMSTRYFKLPTGQLNTGGDPNLFPVVQYQSNIWTVRYASGLFFLF